MVNYRKENAARFYRQVPMHPRLVGGDASAQLKNNKI
jgi:hypothetical protein